MKSLLETIDALGDAVRKLKRRNWKAPCQPRFQCGMACALSGKENNVKSNCYRVTVALAAVLLCATMSPARADTILESAQLGPTGQTGGYIIDSGQHLGVRFTITQAYRITRLAIHANSWSNPTGAPVFMAINPLASASSFPSSIRLSDAVFTGLVQLPPTSAEVSLSTNFLLPAGHYSFMVGSGLFGATGSGTAPSNNPDIGTPSYFFRSYQGMFFNGGFNSVRFVIEGYPATNQPPTASAGGPYSVAEGASVTLAGSGSDPDGGPLTYVWDLNNDGSFETSGQSPTFSASGRDGPSSQTVVLKVTDSQGAFATSPATVNITNVAPSVTINGAPTTGAEGIGISLSSSVTDPGTPETFSYTWSVTKNGSPFGSGNSSSFSFTPDDNGTYVVSLTVGDGDGGSGSDSKTINVTNVAPTSAITGAPASGPEGTGISLGSSVTDPSSADTAAGITRSWAVTKNGSPFASGSGAGFNFTPNDNGTYVVTLTATDKDGGTGPADSKTIMVTNVNPTVTITGAPASSPEGTPISLGSSVTDPGSADTHTRAWSVTKNGSPFGSGAGASFSFTPDDNGTYVVTLTGTDDDGGSGGDSKTIDVTNVAPEVTITGPASGALFPIQQQVTFTSTFADKGTNDTHTATWQGMSATAMATPMANVVESSGSGTANSFPFTFSTPGVYNFTHTVQDDDGGVGTANIVGGLGGLPAMVVIYDPNGSFVTGGGWINSPVVPGLYYMQVDGKASFGFVSKYLPGANTPSGNTEFQFKAGGLNFKSTAYEWLVVAGARAQFKGYGTINGVGNYGFMLTAIDGQVAGGGGVDRFRIKIWGTSGVVYDNQAGAPDNDSLSAPSTALGGGSVVIHK